MNRKERKKDETMTHGGVTYRKVPGYGLDGKPAEFWVAVEPNPSQGKGDGR